MINGKKPELDEQLTALAAKKWSSTQIARELGITRNAVIGRCSRRGIKLISQAGHQSVSKARVSVAVQPATPISMSTLLRPPKRSHKRKSPLAVASSPVCDASTHVDIMGLTQWTCRWPIGEPSDWDAFSYCGGATESVAAPYCPHHMAKAYTPRGLLQARKEGAYNVRRFG